MISLASATDLNGITQIFRHIFFIIPDGFVRYGHRLKGFLEKSRDRGFIKRGGADNVLTVSRANPSQDAQRGCECNEAISVIPRSIRSNPLSRI